MKERILLDGVMPERAINRLVRSGVSVGRVKRLSKTQTVFLIDANDSEKVFSIYPKLPTAASAYTAKSLGKVGLGARLERLRKRVGVFLGAFLFLGLTLYADTLILKVEIQTDTALKTEILQVLEENGVQEFTVFSGKNIDFISAQILSLEGVSFCSIKKTGSICIVEVRGSSFAQVEKRASVFTAERTGVLQSLVVLRGQRLVADGESVEKGTVLVKANGEEDFVVARASLLCVYEAVFEETDEQRALAQGVLAVGGEDERVRILAREVKQEEEKTVVRIEYEYLFSVNYS